VVFKSGGQKDLTERHTYVIGSLDISTLSVFTYLTRVISYIASSNIDKMVSLAIRRGE